MKIPAQLFLDGAWRNGSSGRRTTLINPATEEPFAEVAAADVADVNAAVESAQRAWESGWRDLAPGKRAEILFNVARVLREHLEEIAQLEMLQIGKPISDARDEAGLGARVFEYYAGAIRKFYGQTIPVARGGFDFHVAPADGRRGGDCAVEFSVSDRVLESRARARRRQLRRAQARVALAAHGAQARRTGPRRRFAARRVAGVAGLRFARSAMRWSPIRSFARFPSPVRPRSAGASWNWRRGISNASRSNSAASRRTSCSPTPTGSAPPRPRR